MAEVAGVAEFVFSTHQSLSGAQWFASQGSCDVRFVIGFVY